MAVSNPPSYLQGGSHPARGLRRMTEAMTGDTEGALAAGELVVSEKSGTPNMSVDVSAGRAFILGTESAFQGTYFVESRGVENLTISAADATNPRKDIVVARVEDSEESGATDAWSLEVIAGTPAASPTAPAQPANSLLLATVDVAALASSITDANITTSTPVWAPAPVDTVGLVDGAVTEAKLAAGSVTSTKLATDSVSAAAIQAGAVGASEIATGAVGSSEIGTGAVGSTALADGAVTNDKLAASGLDASKITTGTLPSSVLPAIDGSTLDNNSVALGTKTTGNYAADVDAGSGISVSGTAGEGTTFTVSHADTSTQATVNNSNGTVIQDVTLDTYGHVTVLGSVNLDSRYYTESESDSRFLGISAKAADSEKLDNLDSSQFLRSDASDTTSGKVTFSGGGGTVGSQAINIYQTGGGANAGIGFNYPNTSPAQYGIFRMSNSTLHRFLCLQQDNSSYASIGAASFPVLSDVTLKTKTGDVPGLDFVLSLDPFAGHWNDKDESETSFWLGAQEVEAALVAAGIDADVHTVVTEDENSKTLDYMQLVPVLVQAIKDLEARVAELEGQ